MCVMVFELLVLGHHLTLLCCLRRVVGCRCGMESARLGPLGEPVMAIVSAITASCTVPILTIHLQMETGTASRFLLWKMWLQPGM